MNTNQLKKFAKEARIKLITQIGVKLDLNTMAYNVGHSQ